MTDKQITEYLLQYVSINHRKCYSILRQSGITVMPAYKVRYQHPQTGF